MQEFLIFLKDFIGFALLSVIGGYALYRASGYGDK